MKLAMRLGIFLGSLLVAYLLFAFTVYMRIAEKTAFFAIDVLLPLTLLFGLTALVFGTSLRDRQFSEWQLVAIGLAIAALGVGYAIALRESEPWLLAYYDLADMLGVLPESS